MAKHVRITLEIGPKGKKVVAAARAAVVTEALAAATTAGMGSVNSNVASATPTAQASQCRCS